MFKYLLIALIFLIVSCSSQQLYNWGQEIGRDRADCEKLVNPEERLACEEQFDKNYEEYRKERERALKEPQK